MTDLNDNLRYVLNDEVAIEDFEDGSLLFLCKQLRLIQLSQTARFILPLLDGKRTIRQIADEIAQKYKIPETEARADIKELITHLGTQGIVKPIVELSLQRTEKMSDSTRFLVNPDVSFREENQEGAILFNPDSNALQVINPIGVIIWRFLAHPHTQAEIINHLLDVCEDVPHDQVKKDVDDFIVSLQSMGFIGEIVNDNNK